MRPISCLALLVAAVWTTGCGVRTSSVAGQTSTTIGTKPAAQPTVAAIKPIPAEPPPPEPAKPREEVSRGVGVFSQRDLQKARGEIEQLGKLILAEYLSRGKGPATVQELKDQMRDAAKLYQALENGTYKLVPNASFNSNTVFLYEGLADRNGNRLVVYGDGRVEGMNAAEFQKLEATLKGVGK